MADGNTHLNTMHYGNMTNMNTMDIARFCFRSDLNHATYTGTQVTVASFVAKANADRDRHHIEDLIVERESAGYAESEIVQASHPGLAPMTYHFPWADPALWADDQPGSVERFYD